MYPVQSVTHLSAGQLSSTASLVAGVAEGRRLHHSSLLPVTIRGEMPGRAMRGGADLRQG
ncbi:MAG: hypothetical protein E5W20_01815 [Mesorhizobium sp.]|nr:MAG: hypothetical protein E5W20_01815 [Mesorhizobium sp.]